MDRSLVTSLKQGSVFLNSGPYKNSVFKVGDVVSYKCKNGFTLTGPSQVTCSGIGKWKPWDKGRTECGRNKILVFDSSWFLPEGNLETSVL